MSPNYLLFVQVLDRKSRGIQNVYLKTKKVIVEDETNIVNDGVSKD
ncbi:MAG: hypothetical protein HOD92_22835 [Deltaproteobacteria bacterium]|nr:hypothetical protein [Deltaproteobacteria bacterium]